MALLGQRAENQFVGVNCGILDQYSSAMGQAGTALLLDCRHLSSRTAAIAPGIQPVICDTSFKRALTGSEYGERRAQCEEGARLLGVAALRDVSREQYLAHESALPPLVARRCRFIVEENQRVLDLAAALPLGDHALLSDLMAASFAGARDLYEIAVPQMEAMMATMLSGPGVIGARQAGAGFGGCMVALVESGDIAAFADHVQTHYTATTGLQARVYAVKAVPGAGALQFN
jgi:galactokinase